MWLRGPNMNRMLVIMATKCGAVKIWRPTGPGPTSMTTVGSGDQTSRCSITITSSTGLLIAMDRGSGARLMGGRGPATNPGAGRLITTVVGSTTTTSGRGV